MTVETLLDLIEYYNIPKDAQIVYERIEDKYFDGINISGMRGLDGIYPEGSKADGWDTIKIKGEHYQECVNFNENLAKGQLVKEGKLGKDEVGRLFWDDEFKELHTPIDLNDERLLDQYIKISTCFYNREKNMVCLTAHC